ncbi:MAG: purine-nucleoside phosphorylase [Gemmatimonadaceae bacterium]
MTVADAVAVIRTHLPVDRPVAAIVLGSGLGGLAAKLQTARRLPYAEIPGFALTAVAGHEGTLLHGTLGGREVLAFSGRFHVYEGHSMAQAALPVRVARLFGADVLVLSNAAGGVRRTFRPGQLMLIRDHVNFTFRNPLVGPRLDGDERFPDMSEPYDPGLRKLFRSVAAEQGTALEEGVYCGLTGPTYETPAEVRMLERMGVDAVGMSTVPEVIVARAIGMRVAGISCITNAAAGLSPEPIHHDHVIEATAGAAREFERLVEGAVSKIGRAGARAHGPTGA